MDYHTRQERLMPGTSKALTESIVSWKTLRPDIPSARRLKNLWGAGHDLQAVKLYGAAVQELEGVSPG